MYAWLISLMLLLLPVSAQAQPIISGLDHLPVITQETAQSFPEPSQKAMLTLDGISLPHDAASNTYFVPQSADTIDFDGEILLQETPGYTYYILPDALCDKAEALSRSRGYTIYGTNGTHTQMSTVLFTALPVLHISTQNGLPGEEDEACTILYYSVNPDLTVQKLDAEINLRGNTSKIFPKQSYRVQLLDAFGDNRHVSLANLRKDDDWILNPLYTDSTKLREKFAYELWDMLNSSGSAAQSSRMAYVEVFFNGEYHGLYGLQERVDMKQVNGSKKNDILYKVRTNQRPTVEELLSCTDRTSCMAFEVENGDDFRGDTASLYRPAAAYMAALNGETLDPSITLSLSNTIDYGLFALLTQAHDSHFKNQFLNAVSLPDKTILYKLPWDLNYTLGDVYQKELEHTNYTEYHIGTLVMDACFETLLGQNDPTVMKAIQLRWQTLRSDILTKENLSQLLKAADDALFAARARDHVRWPGSGKGEGNNADYEEIVHYFAYMLPRIDEWIDALSAGN